MYIYGRVRKLVSLLFGKRGYQKPYAPDPMRRILPYAPDPMRCTWSAAKLPKMACPP